MSSPDSPFNSPLTPEQRRQLGEEARELRESMPQDDLPSDSVNAEDADDAKAAEKPPV